MGLTALFLLLESEIFSSTESSDEENISSNIKINDLTLELGERVYNHLLLHLVRVRKQDLECGMDNRSCGWVQLEELNHALSKEMLRDVDEYYVNILIHRLRKNLINLIPYGHLFTHIIERKKGKLRFGLLNFQIEKEHGIVRN